jgi:hypothetical protein
MAPASIGTNGTCGGPDQLPEERHEDRKQGKRGQEDAYEGSEDCQENEDRQTDQQPKYAQSLAEVILSKHQAAVCVGCGSAARSPSR